MPEGSDVSALSPTSRNILGQIASVGFPCVVAVSQPIDVPVVASGHWHGGTGSGENRLVVNNEGWGRVRT